MKRTFAQRLGLPAAMGLMAVAFAPVFAQAPMGKIHGHVTNPAGAAQTAGSISLSTDGGHNSKFTFPVSANGDYAGEAAPGKYTLVFRQPDTPPGSMVDSIENIVVKAGEDTLANDDMSRQAYIDKLPAAQKKQLEELRKSNAAALKANEIIKHANLDLDTVAADIKAADGARAAAQQELGAGASKQAIDAKEAEIKAAKYGEAESLMQQDTQVMPIVPVLWTRLGQAEVGLKKYDEAETAYKKALELETDPKNKKPSPDIQGLAHSGLGELYARTNKTQPAEDEFDAAAKANPAQAQFYLRNEAVIFFQMNNTDAQVAAADKAIAIDPNSPASAIPYYLKANGLVGKTTEDPKTHKLVAPPGCIEAYQKYLELAPNGPYASEVKQIIAGFSQIVDTAGMEKKKKK